jgi:hypothetical protein
MRRRPPGFKVRYFHWVVYSLSGAIYEVGSALLLSDAKDRAEKRARKVLLGVQADSPAGDRTSLRLGREPTE